MFVPCDVTSDCDSRRLGKGKVVFLSIMELSIRAIIDSVARQSFRFDEVMLFDGLLECGGLVWAFKNPFG